MEALELPAAGNALYGTVYALSFGVGTVVPLKVFKSTTPLRVFRATCGAILILFGLQLFYSVWQRL